MSQTVITFDTEQVVSSDTVVNRGVISFDGETTLYAVGTTVAETALVQSGPQGVQGVPGVQGNHAYLIESGGAYPVRPAGVPGGITWVGTTNPSASMVTGDVWVKNDPAALTPDYVARSEFNGLFDTRIGTKSIDVLSDVTVTNPVTGNVIRWSGTEWANAVLAIADVANLQTTLDGKAASVHTHAAGDTTTGTFDIARLPVAPSGTSSITQVPRADDARLSDTRVPTDGSVTDIKVAAANKDGTAATPSLRTLGTGATQAAAGNHAHSAWGKDYHKVVITSGDIVLNQTAITGIAVTDITFPAAAGDLIEYGISGRVEATATHVGFEVYTVVATALTNPFGPGLSASVAAAAGIPGWWCTNVAQNLNLTGDAPPRTLVAGDIEGGNVTLRLAYAKIDITARTLNANAQAPLIVWAKNLGQLS